MPEEEWRFCSLCSITSAWSTDAPAWKWVSAAGRVKFRQTMNEFVAKITSLGKERQTGGFEMQEMINHKTLLSDGTVNRVLGWRH